MRLLDIILSSLLLTILFPLIFFIMILLYIFNHKVFFLSKRIGKKGLKFHLIKFSTIKIKSKTPSKEKFSFFGKFLRRSSLDEIPQLFNVLLGDMSLVGPRPLPIEIENKIPKKYRMIRRSLLPGITGNSQLHYKGKKRTLVSKVIKDIEYINNDNNLVNYLKIICITPFYILIKFKKNKSGYSL
jgi:lipopolysaccharide/colanic/teichoic acid biosynthesis glycosyltransferase